MKFRIKYMANVKHKLSTIRKHSQTEFQTFHCILKLHLKVESKQIRNKHIFEWLECEELRIYLRVGVRSEMWVCILSLKDICFCCCGNWWGFFRFPQCTHIFFPKRKHNLLLGCRLVPMIMKILLTNFPSQREISQFQN